MSIETLLTFSLASVLLSLAPGPDNMFVMIQSALFGRKAGLLITLGLCTGLLVHTALVATGVAVIFQVSDVAFTVLKIAGASYLFYLAFYAFRQVAKQARVGSQPQLTPSQLYVRGVIMNLTNPKVAIFFLAFLPQFTDPARGFIGFQIIVLGVIFIVIALIVFSIFSVAATGMANWLRHSRSAEQTLQGLACLVYLGLALRLTLSTV